MIDFFPLFFFKDFYQIYPNFLNFWATKMSFISKWGSFSPGIDWFALFSCQSRHFEDRAGTFKVELKDLIFWLFAFCWPNVHCQVVLWLAFQLPRSLSLRHHSTRPTLLAVSRYFVIFFFFCLFVLCHICLLYFRFLLRFCFFLFVFYHISHLSFCIFSHFYYVFF